MKRRDDKINFQKFARDLLILPTDEIGAEKQAIASRYCDTRHRIRVLERGMRIAHKNARIGNALAAHGFKPPLSVAGSTSDVIVRAEMLAMLGIPIAFTFDSKGRHRGFAIDDAVEALGINGSPASPLQVLDLYRQMMSAMPNMLANHDETRFQKIPRMLNRLSILRNHLEHSLTMAFAPEVEQHEPMFTVLVDRDVLGAVLVGSRRPVVLGCSAKALCVNGVNIDRVWSKGGGAVVIDRRHLRKLLKRTTGQIIGIQCRLGDWVAWTEEDARARRSAGGKRRETSQISPYYDSAAD